MLESFGPETIAVRFHDTRNLGIALAWSAFECGVRRFASSFDGLGSTPFALGASGNIDTEDILFMLGEAGVDTGVDLERLLEATKIVQTLVDPTAGGRIFPWA
jgi:hydroxymethylglutaryl-CoA lyase